MIQINQGQLLLAVILFVFAGCKKVQEDKIPPLIRLVGNNPDIVLMGCNYMPRGAIVVDDKPIDSDSYTVTGEVNTDSAGTYYLNYTAFDADSNMAFEQRMVIVDSLSNEFYEDAYTVTDTLLTVIPRQVTTYSVTIDWLSQNQNLFRISNFNNLGDDFELLFQPDSNGNFPITYEEEDLTISGDGWVKCNLGGLRMTYNVELPDEYQSHKATYLK